MRRFSLLLLATATFFVGAYASSAEGDDEIAADIAKFSGEQLVDQSGEKIEKMRKTLDETNTLLDNARAQQEDILKLNCINEKLGGIKGFVKVAEQAKASMAEGVREKNRKGVEHNYTLVVLADGRVEVLSDEAKTCTGSDGLFGVDETDVQRYESPEIAKIDLIQIDDDAFDDSYARERLPELTPYQ